MVGDPLAVAVFESNSLLASRLDKITVTPPAGAGAPSEKVHESCRNLPRDTLLPVESGGQKGAIPDTDTLAATLLNCEGEKPAGTMAVILVLPEAAGRNEVVAEADPA